MSSSKRMRINEVDKKFLAELVVKYQDIVECRKSDVVSNNAKREGWLKITEEFNAQGGGATVSLCQIVFTLLLLRHYLPTIFISSFPLL